MMQNDTGMLLRRKTIESYKMIWIGYTNGPHDGNFLSISINAKVCILVEKISGMGTK